MRSKPQQNAWTIDLEIARLVGQYCSMWGISSVTVIELSLLVLELTIDLMQPVACIVSNLIFLSSTYEAVGQSSLLPSHPSNNSFYILSVYLLLLGFLMGKCGAEIPNQFFPLPGI